MEIRQTSAYFFTPREQTFTVRFMVIILFNRTGKAALKKFRADNSEVNCSAREAGILAELMQDLPETDAEKLHQYLTSQQERVLSQLSKPILFILYCIWQLKKTQK
jgi:hypothetical protein